MTLRMVSVSLAFLAVSCVVPVSSGVIIARVSAGAASLAVCEVALGWTAADLLENCGAPDRLIANASNKSEQCAIYQNDSRSFGTGQGVGTVAVCLGDAGPSRKKHKPITIAGTALDDGSAWRVIRIVGLSTPERTP